MACSTQWRQGFAGRSGLDYGACLALLERYLPAWQDEERAAGGAGVFTELTVTDLMADIQIIERATLDADDERREQDKAARAGGR